jgi:hypothetical protein
MMLTVQYIAQIIQKTLGLDAEHIVIYNQRHEVPSDGSLYVVVGMMSYSPFGSQRYLVPVSGGLKEELCQQVQETITIEAFSKDTSAIERAPEIIGSLNSTYAQQLQEQIGFKIGIIPTTMNDTSFLEGASLLYRVSMTLRVLRAYGQQKTISYYDQFSPAELLTEKGVVE